MNTETYISNTMSLLNVNTYAELAEKLSTTQSSISGWKSRNSTGQLVNKLLENGYEELLPKIFVDFKTNQINNFQESTNHVGINNGTSNINDYEQMEDELDKIFGALKKVAKAFGKEDSLKEFLSSGIQQFSKLS